MEKPIKIHVFHTGEVCVSPFLPFGGEKCNVLKAAGLTTKKKDRLWIPVSAYLIEHPHGLILVDTGWERTISPNGVFDKRAQIKSLGSKLLYKTNQGRLPFGESISEHLAALGYKASDIDYVILSHLDCDHANGLSEVKEAKKFLVSQSEYEFANNKSPMNLIRYNKNWWKGIDLTLFSWNDEEGPYSRAYDVFGDGSVKCINIPGHTPGQVAVKIRNANNKFVLLFADGGYATKSWSELILPGISDDKDQQLASLKWIKEESLNPNCVESLANHDPDIAPHIINL